MLAPWCEYETADESVLHLGQQSIGWWQRYTQVTSRGTLVVASQQDEADLRRFARKTHGFSEVDREALAELEPDLAGRFNRGLFFKNEAHLNPRQALRDLHAVLRTRGCRFVSAATTADDGPCADCRGLAAQDTFSDLRGVKGEMLIIRCPDVTLTRPVRFLHPRIPLYIVPRGDHVYMLGATMIESSDRRRITARSMLELLSAAYALNSAFGEAEILEIGVDARPAFLDNRPHIRVRGSTVYANGLYRHGYLLAPALARETTGLILNGTQPEMLDEDNSQWRK